MTSAEKMREFRAEITALIPWVTVLKRPKKNCTALTNKYWKLGFKTRRDMSDEDKAKYRCSKMGLFRFRALQSPNGGKDGVYCEVHLRSAGIFSTMLEDERYQKWCSKHTVALNLIRVKYGLTPIPTRKELDAIPPRR